MTFTIAFASDHAGFAMKALLVEEVKGLGHRVLDLGPDSEASATIPITAPSSPKPFPKAAPPWGAAIQARQGDGVVGGPLADTVIGSLNAKFATDQVRLK